MERIWSSPEPATSPPTATAQRSPVRQSLSAFFHGRSVISDKTVGQQPKKRKAILHGSCQRPHMHLDMSHLNFSAPPLRSPTSIRSMIDPSSSPASSARPIPSATFEQAYLPLRHSGESMGITERLQRSFDGHARHRKWSGMPWRKTKERTCVAKLKERALRNKIISCLASGGILIIIVVVYLALAASNTATGQEMHVVLILFILVFTVFFCHSLIRLCMLALKPSRRDERDRVPSRAGVGGFAQPHRPIRVVLARDEELGLRGAEAEEGKNLPAPPPAYGLWRGSVRVDPNLLHWQRTERSTSTLQGEQMQNSDGAANRPPSYITDDGFEIPATGHPRVHQTLEIPAAL